jgi:hypothetical protein
MGIHNREGLTPLFFCFIKTADEIDVSGKADDYRKRGDLSGFVPEKFRQKNCPGKKGVK